MTTEEALPTEEATESAEEGQEDVATVELSAEQEAQLTSLIQLYLRAWERAYADGDAPATDVNMVVEAGSSAAIDTQLVLLALGLDGEGLDEYYAQNGQANLAGLNVTVAEDGSVHLAYDALPALLRSVYGTDVADVSYIVNPLLEAGVAQDAGDGWTFYQTDGTQSSALWIANVQSSDDGATFSFDVALLDATGSATVDASTLRYFHVEAALDEDSVFGFHLVSIVEVYDLDETFSDAVSVQNDLENAIAAGTPLAQPVTSYR